MAEQYETRTGQIEAHAGKLMDELDRLGRFGWWAVSVIGLNGDDGSNTFWFTVQRVKSDAPTGLPPRDDAPPEKAAAEYKPGCNNAPARPQQGWNLKPKGQ